ncbi:MAG: RluA family pseudouridine synthase [Sedimentibacter sp.]|uniref:RluA family pseudouridine synthase n=1 Tax=Sedimentibacter sp. TaxID=1960295 RepID=UPI002982981B|nr:RluA family pseudouridine synthase [Sedimentibacter sp.]MDW5299824.1 RluA family pseudouridine synthase [Sedimentibacter sp.]
MTNNNLLNYTIQENDKTVKSIMRENLNFSQRLSKRLEMSESILLNGSVVKLNKKVFIGDILSIGFDEEEDEYDAIDIPIDIVYEDSDLLVVNKPPYIVVHPTKSHQNNTVANGVAYYFKKNGIKRKVRLVNRLDMNTSGIVIIAKNPYAHNELANQMKMDTVDKYYYAVVEGIIKEDKGTINQPIARLNPEDIIRIVHTSGKECITHYAVEKRFNNMTLVRVKLDTGRTHQIRVHMKHIGHPIVGDALYGQESRLINRQALHCCEMKFKQPLTGQDIVIKCPMPDDIIKVMNN